MKKKIWISVFAGICFVWLFLSLNRSPIHQNNPKIAAQTASQKGFQEAQGDNPSAPNSEVAEQKTGESAAEKPNAEEVVRVASLSMEESQALKLKDSNAYFHQLQRERAAGSGEFLPVTEEARQARALERTKERLVKYLEAKKTGQ